MTIFLTSIASVFIGGIIGYAIRKILISQKQKAYEAKTEKLLSEAKTKGREILLEARDKAIKFIEKVKKEEAERRRQLSHIESRLEKREENLDKKLSLIERKQRELERESFHVRQTREELRSIRKRQLATLEKVASLSREKAREVLLEMVEKEMKEKVLARMRKVKKQYEEEAEKKAREIIALAIQRYAGSQASETTATTVTLPSDEMKGRIIGREGRNIRRIEQLCGVEIVVDDTPEAIVVSGFSPVRRQVAKRALDSLIADGRIHPARIEDAVEKAKKEIALEMKEAGEAACYDLGIAGLDPKLISLIGRLKFRSSYGQNVLQHSIEVANLAAIMAQELKADVSVAKKAGLLHDIGKAVDHEIEGTHIKIGRDILSKFGMPEEVIHAMECHHGDVEPRSVEAMIVAAADAISGARVGARKDTYEDYLKRLEELETIAKSFEGVEKAYAIQAGREVRIFVQPEKIDDLGAEKLSQKIADKIEEQLKYPGEIKVNVIREKRAINFAR